GQPRTAGSPQPDELYELLVARDDDGRAVGAARLELPTRDNLHFCAVDVQVLPDARRRGFGTALLAAAIDRAQAAGRTTMVMRIDEPPAQEGRSPARAFATRHGFARATAEVRRDLALPVDAARLDAVESECRPHAAGYLLRTWQDRCPDDLVDDRAALGARMSTDAPLEELDWHAERWDAERVRRNEALVARQGRSFLAAGAVDQSSGRLVAFTELGVPLARPERVYQWDTLVLPEHRGHRLGTLVKIGVLRLIPERVPQARLVSTWNAAVNVPMIAVNERLGFRTNGSMSSWQRTL
ncbi:MAG TPA: GNAT family N-acetyltransferase, partial [Mycobacteriales bacterium]|nr:GNAT family N-acetyltransferase [Mycobacteriales bacterium]